MHLQSLDLQQCPLWTPGPDFDLDSKHRCNCDLLGIFETILTSLAHWSIKHWDQEFLGSLYKRYWSSTVAVKIGLWEWPPVVHHCIFENIVTTLSRWSIKHWDQAGQQIHPQLRPVLLTSTSSYFSNSGQNHICHVSGSLLSKRLKVPFSRAVVGSRV